MNADLQIQQLVELLWQLGPPTGMTIFPFLLARWLIAELRYLLLPAHERIIERYAIQKELADQFRQQLFLDQTYHALSLQRWTTTRQRIEHIARELVSLTKEVDALLSCIAAKDPTLGKAVSELCTYLIKDLASATWVAQDWDEKIRAIEQFQVLLDGAKENQVTSRKI